MMDIYVAEQQIKYEQARMNKVTKNAWKWFAGSSFCKRCLEEELNKQITVE